MEFKSRRTFIVLASGIAAAITVAAIVVPMVVDSGKTLSSAGSVEIKGSAPAPNRTKGPYSDAPVIGELANAIITQSTSGSANFWRIPVDAPFSEMPEGIGCNPAQIAWLVKHAEPGRVVGGPVETRVHNNADTGASMSIGNIHLEGEQVENSQVVTLQCAGTGGGGSQIIELAINGSPGVWGEPTGWDQNPQPQGSIATLNLAPGEVADITFLIEETTKRFQGQIVADRGGSTPGSVVLVDVLDFPSLPMPGYYLSYVNGELECSKPDTPTVTCTFAEAEKLLREAGKL